MNLPDGQRTIRSYARRSGRITGTQRRALEAYWPLYGVDYQKTVLDLDKLFSRQAPRYLEIGSGMGNTTTELATRHRDNDYIAVEVHRPGVGALMNKIAAYQLTNIRLIAHDVVDVLETQLPANSMDCIYIFFPDPWPKKNTIKDV